MHCRFRPELPGVLDDRRGSPISSAHPGGLARNRSPISGTAPEGLGWKHGSLTSLAKPPHGARRRFTPTLSASRIGSSETGRSHLHDAEITLDVRERLFSPDGVVTREASSRRLPAAHVCDRGV